MLLYGIDRIEQYLSWIQDGRVGLVTTVTGRSSANESTISILQRHCRLSVLFGPEHGIRGDHDAGAATEDYVDPATGLTVYSLYGGDGQHLTKEMLQSFDVLVFDIQDVGLRFFTFLSTLYYVLQDCAAAGKRLVVLDRPNPLGGWQVEGGLLQDKYRSFVGCCPLTVRYGLTLGEFALMINQEEELHCDLYVVPCSGYRREMFPEWDKIWQIPSPALSTFEATLLYAGTCIFEGTALSEGRGTSAPFRVIGAPGVDAEQLTKDFCARQLPGVTATPYYFKPTSSKHCGELCGGLALHVTDREELRPVAMGVELLDLFQKMYPEQAAFLPPPEEGQLSFVERLTGCGDFMPGWSKEAILSRYEEESMEFVKRKNAYHLYS